MKKLLLLLSLFTLIPTATMHALKNKQYNYLKVNEINVMERLNVAGSEFIGGGLEVNGPVLLHSSLIVEGPISTSIGLNTTGNLTVGGNLTVLGATLLNNGLTVNGPTVLDGNVTVTGVITAPEVTITGPITNPTDAATKSYVDAVARAGFHVHPSVRLVSTVNVTPLVGLTVIDGVLTNAGDRVLLTAQISAVQNGIWVVAVGAWTRPSDFASGQEAGTALVEVTAGVTNANTTWVCTTPTAIIDTDPNFWTKFTVVAGINEGGGTGSVFDSATGTTLTFRTLLENNHILIMTDPNDVQISTDGATAATPNTLVARDGSGNIAANGLTLSTPLLVSSGGTGDSSLTAHAVLVGEGISSIAQVGPGTTGQVLTSNGAASDPSFQTPTVAASNITGVVAVVHGGTGDSSLTAHTVLVGEGTSPIAQVGPGTAGQVLTSNGAASDPSFQTPTVAASNITGVVAVAHGGTGDSTLTAHAVLVGEGTSPVAQVGPGTAGAVLVSGGASADPSFVVPTTTGSGLSLTTNASTLNYSLVTPVSIANGGTNATSMTNIDGVVYFDGTKLNTTAVGTANQVLTSNGAGNAPTFQSASASGAVTQINGDTGSALPVAGVINVTAGNPTNCGVTVKFVASGSTDELNVTDANENTSVGQGAGGGGSGIDNTAFGFQALNQASSISTNGNCAIGAGALANLTGGSDNTAIGLQVGTNLTTGSSNILLGANAGINYSGAESDNICIGNAGVALDGTGLSNPNVIRIGGASAACIITSIANTFLSGGIDDVHVGTDVGNLGLLGRKVSSSRYKNNIKDMGEQSSVMLKLRPVTFCYNSDNANRRQWGLIAEEVAEIMPEIVSYNDKGEPNGVRYSELPAILLNEVQKLHCELKKQHDIIEELKMHLSMK